MDKQKEVSRREFVKKAAYVTPAILTLAAAPAFAKAGSQRPDSRVSPVVDRKEELAPGLVGREELPAGLAKKEQPPPTYADGDAPPPPALAKMGARRWRR